jgi:hypothetical protein
MSAIQRGRDGEIEGGERNAGSKRRGERVWDREGEGDGMGMGVTGETGSGRCR